MSSRSPFPYDGPQRAPYDPRQQQALASYDAQAGERGAISTAAGDDVAIVRTQRPIRALIAATGLASIAQNAETLGAEILAPEDGWIEELVLGAQDKSDQSIVRWALHIKISTPPRNEAIATDGSGPAYVPFSALYDDGRPVPLEIFIRQNQRLTFDVKNLSLTAIAYVPIVVARFRPTAG